MPKSNVDYATDNITVYREPCQFQCRYCWAWRIPLFSTRVTKGSYDPFEEASKYAKMRTPRIIVVSFTNDPYPPREKMLERTRRVLGILALNKLHKVLVLTKNPILALRDLDVFGEHRNMWLGSTVISLRQTDWEPYAPHPLERLKALRFAHNKGVKTWLSIEPIIPGVTDAEAIIRESLSYIDWYVLGSFNYSERLAKIPKSQLKKWYKEEIPKAVKLLEEHGKPYHIKKELQNIIQF